MKGTMVQARTAKSIIDVEQLWALRRTGFYAEALRVYEQIHAALNISGPFKLDEYFECYKQSLTLTKALELLIFPASVLTREGDVERSERALDRIRDLYEWHRISFGFQFHLQRGLNALSVGRYLECYKHFRQAVHSSEPGWQSIQARLNVMIAEESLGIRPKNMNELDVEIKSFSQKELVQDQAEQFSSLVLRVAWYDCRDPSQEFSSVLHRDYQCAQSHFFVGWLASLPHAGHVDTDLFNRSCRKLMAAETAYMGAFRLRTLRLHEIEDDHKLQIRHSDQVLRLYLWAWLWLAHPSEELGQKIVRLIRSLAKKMPLSLSFNDHLMLKNVIRWLSLLGLITRSVVERSSMSWAKHAFDSGSRSDYKCYLLYFESLLLNYLEAQILELGSEKVKYAAASLQQEIKSLSHHTPIVQLARDLTGMSKSGIEGEHDLRILLNTVQNLRLSAATSDKPLFVDLLSGSLYKKNEQPLQSRSLAKAISLLRLKTHVGLDDFVSHVFDFGCYQDRHEARLAKLLSQCNKYLKGFTIIHKRDKQIVRERCFYDDIDIKGEHFHHIFNAKTQLDEALRSISSNSFVEENTTCETETITPGLGVSEMRERSLKRPEIEQLLTCSSSTAKRIIQDLLKKDIIIRQGIGKSTTYVVKSEQAFLSFIDQ